MKRMTKLSGSTELEIDVNNLDWVMSLLTDEGELPTYVVKFITVVVAS